jgi:hypothetical protein
MGVLLFKGVWGGRARRSPARGTGLWSPTQGGNLGGRTGGVGAATGGERGCGNRTRTAVRGARFPCPCEAPKTMQQE